VVVVGTETQLASVAAMPRLGDGVLPQIQRKRKFLGFRHRRKLAQTGSMTIGRKAG
jgi:hypothetical protein